MSSVEARLRELLEEIAETLKASPDPFKIPVREILDELAALLPRARLEDLPLDAEILEKLAEVVQRQGEWLEGEAGALALGRLFALLKVKLLSKRELALSLLACWRPIVELEQVTFTDVLRALDYLGKRLPREPGVREEEAGSISWREMAALGVVSERKFEEAVETVRSRLKRLLSNRPKVDYGEVVAGESFEETYLNAYALSHLASLGEFTVLYDPIGDRYYVARGGEEGEPVSVVVPLKKVVESAG